jgi:hypothetical protein
LYLLVEPQLVFHGRVGITVAVQLPGRRVQDHLNITGIATLQVSLQYLDARMPREETDLNPLVGHGGLLNGV